MKLKILFVDDDQNILDGFRAMLHSMRREWICLYTDSTEKALELMEQEPFDVIIADMRMPGMDGADMLKVAERRCPGAMRIVLSGYSEPQALLKSASYAHQYLSKPCDTATIVNTIRRLAHLRRLLANEDVRTLVTRIDSLPALPDHLLKIRRELEMECPDLKYVATLVQEDMGLSATLMKVVNSSFFGFYDKVVMPSRAVILLGVEILKGLVVGRHFFRQLETGAMQWYSVARLWGHCLQTGAMVRKIADMESGDRDFLDNCFIAGFLHDVGKLVFLTQMGDLYRPVIEEVRRRGGPVVDVEREVLGITHAEIGAYLLGLWGFNESVVNGVWRHHAPEPCQEISDTALMVHVADVLQHELAPQRGGYRFSSMSQQCLEELELEDHVDGWRETCMNILEEGHEH